MYISKSFFTLGITSFNIVISLLMIALTAWYCAIHYEKISVFLKTKLQESLNRLFNGVNDQPLYKVFYGFNHVSINAWVNWIKTQNERQQERAFARLAEYLQEPPNKLGSITVEVIKAVLAFEHESSYEVLTQLLKNTAAKWGQYRVLNLFYEETAIAIIKLNPEEAKKFLLNELSAIKKITDMDSIKSSILTALTHLEDKNDLIATFANICLDSQQSLYIRNKAILTIEDACEEEGFYSFINNLFLKFLATENLTKDDLDIYDLILEKMMHIFTQEKYSKEIWDLLCKALSNKLLGNNAAQTLAIKIKNPEFSINREKLEHLLKSYLELKNIFIEALTERFNFSKEELALIKDTEENQNLLEEYKVRDQIIKIYDQSVSHSLLQILEANYATFANQAQKLKSRMLLITGKAEIEKIYFAELLAKELKRKFIYINGNTLILSPDKMNEVLSLINDNQSYLIYIENVFEILKDSLTTNQVENNYRIEEFNKILYKLQHNPKAIVLTTIPLDMVDIYDNHPELAALIKDLPNERFSASIDISSANARFKQKVYSHCEIQLRDNRDFSALKLEELLYKTEDMSSIEFVDFFLQYLRISLLTEGKLLPLEGSEHKVEKELI